MGDLLEIWEENADRAIGKAWELGYQDVRATPYMLSALYYQNKMMIHLLKNQSGSA